MLFERIDSRVLSSFRVLTTLIPWIRKTSLDTNSLLEPVTLGSSLRNDRSKPSKGRPSLLTSCQVIPPKTISPREVLRERMRMKLLISLPFSNPTREFF